MKQACRNHVHSKIFVRGPEPLTIHIPCRTYPTVYITNSWFRCCSDHLIYPGWTWPAWHLLGHLIARCLPSCLQGLRATQQCWLLYYIFFTLQVHVSISRTWTKRGPFDVVITSSLLTAPQLPGNSELVTNFVRDFCEGLVLCPLVHNYLLDGFHQQPNGHR